MTPFANQNISVTDFFQDQASHPRHGTLSNIQKKLLSFDNNIFFEPDFFNWMFPWITVEENLTIAPLVNSNDLEQFRQHYELRRTFNHSIQIILHYYGMDTQGDTVKASENFAQVANLWLTHPDFTNLKRITHLLQSMTLLGEKQQAEGMLAVLKRISEAFPNYITNELIQQWQQAIAEGEKNFYLLFDQPLYSYQQFWQQSIVEKTLAIKQLLFRNPKNAELFVNIMQDKGFHSTRVNDEISTLKPYPHHSKIIIYLTPGQLALFNAANFHLPTDDKMVTGKELLEMLLK